VPAFDRFSALNFRHCVPDFAAKCFERTRLGPRWWIRILGLFIGGVSAGLPLLNTPALPSGGR